MCSVFTSWEMSGSIYNTCGLQKNSDKTVREQEPDRTGKPQKFSGEKAATRKWNAAPLLSDQGLSLSSVS